jgi:cyclopropane fatty-acyl-phospholipid synthase-like methyltransferase
MNQYKYPDPNDSITISLISQFEMYKNYWGESEENVLKIIFKYLRGLQDGSLLSFLDIGSGDGRLFEGFSNYFHLIHAIEPDVQRFNSCQQKISELKISNKTTVQNKTLEEYESKIKYDFILCSHIIQHIESGKVVSFLQKIYSLLNYDGLIALTTCHSTRNTDYFYKSYIKDTSTVEEEIKEPEFNSLILAENVLPIHFFNFDILKKQLEQIGFKIEHFRIFHIESIKNISQTNMFIDDYVNEKKELQRTLGRDMLIILKK